MVSVAIKKISLGVPQSGHICYNFSFSGFKCPAPDTIYPCECYTTGSVGCYFKDNITQESVDNLFVRLRKINDVSSDEIFHFPPETGEFTLRESRIVEFDLTPFVNVSMHRIFLGDNSDLIRIKGPDLSVSQGSISVKWISVLDYGINDTGFGETLKYFNAETLIRLHLLQTNLTGKTSGELLPGFWNFKNLEEVDFGYSPIEIITARQFAPFLKLSSVTFGPIYDPYYDELTLEPHAFALHQEYNNRNKGKSLSLNFPNRHLNEMNFNVKELGLLNYPDVSISLDLSFNKFERISQENFEPFLLVNANNKIHISSNPLKCDYRRMGSQQWLVDQRVKYESRLPYAYCEGDPTGCTIFEASSPIHVCRLKLPLIKQQLNTLATVLALSVG